MAKRKKKKRSHASQSRDLVRIARPLRRMRLTVIEDRRKDNALKNQAESGTYHDRHARRSRISRDVPSVEGKQKHEFLDMRDLSQGLYRYFSEPGKVPVCERRWRRKSVLFAMRKVGKGKRVASPKWSNASFIRCKA